MVVLASRTGLCSRSRTKCRAHYTRFYTRNAVRPVCKPVPGGIRDSRSRGASQAAGAAPTLRYGPAGDSAPRLRLKASGMTERFPFGPASTARKSTPRCPFGRIAIYGYRTLSNDIKSLADLYPPFSLINSHLFRSARSSPGREAAKRTTLDGEDRLIFLCTPVITTNCRCYGMIEFGWDLNGTRPRT